VPLIETKQSGEAGSDVASEEGSDDTVDADFLEDEDDEDEDDEDDDEDNIGSAIASKIAAGAKSQNRADFLSSTEIRHLTAAFEVCDKAETGELAFPAFMKCLSVMGKKVNNRCLSLHQRSWIHLLPAYPLFFVQLYGVISAKELQNSSCLHGYYVETCTTAVVLAC